MFLGGKPFDLPAAQGRRHTWVMTWHEKYHLQTWLQCQSHCHQEPSVAVLLCCTPDTRRTTFMFLWESGRIKEHQHSDRQFKTRLLQVLYLWTRDMNDVWGIVNIGLSLKGWCKDMLTPIGCASGLTSLELELAISYNIKPMRGEVTDTDQSYSTTFKGSGPQPCLVPWPVSRQAIFWRTSIAAND